MSSNIKGGGRAILSQESQQALIDLLMSLNSDEECSRGHQNHDNISELSAHDKKRARKKFMKQLMHRHEQSQLQRKFNRRAAAANSNKTDSNGNDGGATATPTKPQPPSSQISSASASTNNNNSSITNGSQSQSQNVRVELAEAIFSNAKEKKSKKKSSEKDKNKKKSSSDKQKKSKAGDGESSFKVGAKKVVVLSRTTTVTELLKKSKTKLKLKKNPVRAFVQVEGSSSSIFDLDGDLTAVEDGTVIYVSVTATPPPSSSSELGKQASNDDIDDEYEGGGPSNTATTTTTTMHDDPLESVKRAYQQQEAYHQTPKRKLERMDEIIDRDKKSLLEIARSKLPVSSHKQTILDAVNGNEVVVLSGATGSGKSTQVPQFLLESSNSSSNSNDSICQQRAKKRPYIVVTQPRKVAAISLAQRVAEERGCPPPGAKGSGVGYMVRSDRRVDLRSCRIVYMTIGILLRMLVNPRKANNNTPPGNNNEAGDGEHDGEHEHSNAAVPPLSIDSISHLIIDETHERDVNTDFSLTLLKGMLSSSSSHSPDNNNSMPKLILMSATASSELFCSYFRTKGGVIPVSIEVPGKTFPVDSRWLCDCEKFAGDRMMTRGCGKNDRKADRGNNGNNEQTNVNRGGIQLSPRATDKIDNRFIRSLIIRIVEEQQVQGLLDDTSTNKNELYRATGAILVFLPGLGEIESLARCLYEDGTVASDRNLCKIMKLHSSIPKGDQRRVFQPALVGTVKIVLATNIAETSVTIPDISHVIDTGLVKESRYNPSTRIKELVTVWASRASMKQRAGRAGRTSHGICWRLCSEEYSNDELLSHTVPEMARTPLDELILQIGLLYEQRRDEHMSRVSNSGQSQNQRALFAPGFRPMKFLSNTPTPPAERDLVQACKHLLEVEALEVVDYGTDGSDQLGWHYRLTPLGYHLSRLPMDAKVGKMLIVGCLLGCLENALTIAAALSCPKSCFLSGSQHFKQDPNHIDARDLLIENGFGGKDWPGGTVKGDLIAVIAAYRAWGARNHKEKEMFCRRHALNSTPFREMDTLRRQFFDLMVDAGLTSPRLEGANSSPDADDCNLASEDALLTSCCLVAGLYPNICTLIRPRKGGPRAGRLLTNESDAPCRPSSNSFQKRRVQQASESGKDAYAVYHAKHRSLGAASPSGQKQRPPETFLSEVNFVSKFALLLFGGELELVKNAIIVDKWLKFKVSRDDDEGGAKQINAVLIISLRDLLDKVILEHVVETTISSREEKAAMIERHKRIIEVVRRVLADEG